MPRYTIRLCRTTGELAACVTLQQTIWGYEDAEVYPLRLFVNLGKIGGHVLGAFAGSELVGFVAAMPAWRGGRRYYHSLSLGVLPEHENRGLGRRLKLRQREEALGAGVAWIEWTFDPMRAKNAFFNFVRLGAVARRYVPDYYGSIRSRLQQGLPSDRLVCEWLLRSARVARAIAGGPVRRAARPAEAWVAIPADFASVAAADLPEACRLQARVRARLLSCFRRGMVVTDFVRDGATCRYVLDRDRTVERMARRRRGGSVIS